MPRLPPIQIPDTLARSALEARDGWYLLPGRVSGKLFALGKVRVVAEGPEAGGRAAAEALARSVHVPGPYIALGQFHELMQRQGVPLDVAEAWARSARVTEDGVWLQWERPR